jgi:hypothetical protein
LTGGSFSGAPLSGKASSGKPRLALCGLALIDDCGGNPCGLFFLSRKGCVREPSLESGLTHPQIQYDHLGESPDWQSLSYSGFALIAILTLHARSGPLGMDWNAASV